MGDLHAGQDCCSLGEGFDEQPWSGCCGVHEDAHVGLDQLERRLGGDVRGKW